MTEGWHFSGSGVEDIHTESNTDAPCSGVSYWDFEAYKTVIKSAAGPSGTFDITGYCSPLLYNERLRTINRRAYAVYLALFELNFWLLPSSLRERRFTAATWCFIVEERRQLAHYISNEQICFRLQDIFWPTKADDDERFLRAFEFRYDALIFELSKTVEQPVSLVDEFCPYLSKSDHYAHIYWRTVDRLRQTHQLNPDLETEILRLWHRGDAGGFAFEDCSSCVAKLGKHLSIFDPTPYRSKPVFEPRVNVVIASSHVSALPDSGAEDNFVSARFARRHRLKIDRSKAVNVRLPNGKVIRSVGQVSAPFEFQDGHECRMVQFQVLSKSVHAVVLGRKFLDETQTLTTYFRERVYRCQKQNRLRAGLHYLDSQSFVSGNLDGILVHAVADTGAEEIIMSAEYAERCGYEVRKDLECRKVFEQADGSEVVAQGVITNLSWQYDKDDSQHLCETIFVIEGLSCDLILSFDFLYHTRALGYEDCLIEDISDTLRLDVIMDLPIDVAFRILRAKKASLQSAEQAFLLKKREIQQKLQEKQQATKDLPEDQRETQLAPLILAYNQLMSESMLKKDTSRDTLSRCPTKVRPKLKDLLQSLSVSAKVSSR